MNHHKMLLLCVAIALILIVGSGYAIAEEKKSADEIAKELANPTGSLGQDSLLIIHFFTGLINPAVLQWFFLCAFFEG